VCEDFRPVVPLVPGDLRGWIYFDWHHLADRAALDQDDGGADAACASAALLATLDVCGDEWVARSDVCTVDDVCTLDDELSVGVIRRTGGELDEEGRLADVGGDTFELEGLEAGPAEESGVLGGEAAEELGDVFVWVVGADGLLLGRGHLGHGVLADGLVRWPMFFLALRGTVIGGHTTSTESEWFHRGLLNGATGVANPNASLPVRVVTRRRVVVGGSGGGVVGSHVGRRIRNWF